MLNFKKTNNNEETKNTWQMETRLKQKASRINIQIRWALERDPKPLRVVAISRISFVKIPLPNCSSVARSQVEWKIRIVSCLAMPLARSKLSSTALRWSLTVCLPIVLCIPLLVNMFEGFNDRYLAWGKVLGFLEGLRYLCDQRFTLRSKK
jgi:hypothetical protein